MNAPHTARPWYIGLLLGVAGWFAGIFVLIVAFAMFAPSSGAGAVPVAFVLLSAAFGLFYADREGAFLSQLALALSIAGQFALLFGVYDIFFKHGESIAGMAFVALVIQVALTMVMPNRLHRTMSTLFACVAWAVFVRYGLWDEPPWAHFGRAKVTGPSLPMALAGWLVAWAPIGVALYFLVREEPRWVAAGREPMARPLANGLIVGLAFATLLSHPLDSFTWWWGDPDARQAGLSIWPLLSALASLGALCAAFALGSRGLMALGIVAALLHVSHFYYAMGTSLIVKSVIMMAMGAALLGAAHWVKGPRPP